MVSHDEEGHQLTDEQRAQIHDTHIKQRRELEEAAGVLGFTLVDALDENGQPTGAVRVDSDNPEDNKRLFELVATKMHADMLEGLPPTGAA